MFLLTGLLAGMYPALVLSRFNPVETLYGKLRFGGKNLLAKSLVVLQFTLATFLAIATVIIYSQFSYLVNCLAISAFPATPLLAIYRA